MERRVLLVNGNERIALISVSLCDDLPDSDTECVRRRAVIQGQRQECQGTMSDGIEDSHFIHEWIYGGCLS